MWISRQVEAGDNELLLRIIDVRWRTVPLLVMSGCCLNYLDLFLDIRVALSFQNRHFPPFYYASPDAASPARPTPTSRAPLPCTTKEERKNMSVPVPTRRRR